MYYTGYMGDPTMQQLCHLFSKLREENKTSFAELNRKIDNIYTTLDRQAGMFDTNQTEHLALSKQVDRHDDWIERATLEIGVAYTVQG